MSQYDFGTITASTKTGSDLAGDLNQWRTALHSNHSGTSRPSYAIAGVIWIDTTATPWVVKLYDGADDITLGTANAGSNIFLAANAARSGANSDITSMSGLTTPLSAGQGGTGYSSIGAMINGQTADATPDFSADYALTYDASAEAAKKVLLQNIGGTRAMTALYASGAPVSFTGIPPTARRIVVLFSALSSASTGYPLIRLGTSGGYASSGYNAIAHDAWAADNEAFNTSTSDFQLRGSAPAAAEAMRGMVEFFHLDSNVWIGRGGVYTSGGAATKETTVTGAVALGGTLDRLQVDISGGDTFDGGTINVLYS